MRHDEHIVNTIERKIQEDDLDAVIAELEDISTPRDLYDLHREEYKRAY